VKSSVSLLVLSVAVLIVWSLGCGSANKVALIESDEKMVANCQFVGTFTGHTVAGSALDDALRNASKNGATHYVLMDSSSKQHRGELFQEQDARIRGYKCPSSQNDTTTQNNSPVKKINKKAKKNKSKTEKQTKQ